MPLFAVYDGDEFPAGDDDEPFPDSWPVITAGEARFDTGPPEKAAVYMLGSWTPGSLSLHAPGRGDSLVWGTCFGATEADLRAVWIELG